MSNLKRLAFELARSGLKSCSGKYDAAPLAGMTLDEEDAKLAKKWLEQPEKWEDADTVSSFETAFEHWNGSPYASAFSAGRKALSAGIYALELVPGDEVIIPGYTCVVVQNAFDFSGVRTIYCDIELDTFGPELDSVESCISSRTKAIFIQHLYGLVCRDYVGLLQLAQRRGLKVIEDCAHITGATFRSRRLGTLGDVAFYSSEWTKVFTTVVGGIAVANDRRIGERLKTFALNCAWPDRSVVEQQLRTAIIAFTRAKCRERWWLLPWYRFRHGYEETVGMSQWEIEGKRPHDYLTRMPAPAAALAFNQLAKIDVYNEMRRNSAKLWDKWCETNGYRKPVILSDSIPTFLRYPVLVEVERKRNTEWALNELGVTLGVWFRTNLHPSTQRVRNCPNADRAVAQCVNFPCLMDGGIVN